MGMRPHQTALFVLPLNQWVMDERIQHTHQAVLVVPKQLHGYLACDAEHALHLSDTKAVHYILRESERYALRSLECFSLFML